MRSRTRSYTPRLGARAMSVAGEPWPEWRLRRCECTATRTHTRAPVHLHARALVHARTHANTQPRIRRTCIRSVAREREWGSGCRRVAEVSLTLDGVPVRIVILRDAQRRGAHRVSCPTASVCPSVRPSAIPRTERRERSSSSSAGSHSATRAARRVRTPRHPRGEKGRVIKKKKKRKQERKSIRDT